MSTLSTPARAADGAICYSTPVFITNLSSGFGTTNFPQLSNTTKFSCNTSIPVSTITELSRAGWIIVSAAPAAYSNTINSNGTGNSKTRIMLIVQK